VEGSLWQAVASLATVPALDGWPPTACCGLRIPAGLEPADGYDLIPGPDSDCEGAGAAEEDGVGGIVRPLQGRNDAATLHPDKEDMEGGPQGAPVAAGNPSFAC
jgi:hypothetical protein